MRKILPQDFIDKLKDSVSLKNIIEEYTDLKKIGPSIYMGHCPHPEHNDSTPSFRLFEKGYKNANQVNRFDSWACMGCHSGKKIDDKTVKNYGSDCIAFIMFMEKLNWRQAVKFLADKIHLPMPTEENTALYLNNKILAESLNRNITENSIPYNYLLERNLDSEDISNWMIGYDGVKIIFPLFDKYKNVLGFTRRYIDIPEGCNQKYKNSSTSKIFNKSNYLYGIHNLDDNFDEIRITEGSMDVIMAEKYGVKNIVATLGTAFTDNHINLIKHYNKVPVLIFDNDKAGEKALKKAMLMLSYENIYCKILILPENKDLCDIAVELKDDLESYIKNNSLTYGAYLIKNTLVKYNSELINLKTKVVPEIRSILKQVKSEDELIVLKSFIKNEMSIDI